MSVDAPFAGFIPCTFVPLSQNGGIKHTTDIWALNLSAPPRPPKMTPTYLAEMGARRSSKTASRFIFQSQSQAATTRSLLATVQTSTPHRGLRDILAGGCELQFIYFLKLNRFNITEPWFSSWCWEVWLVAKKYMHVSSKPKDRGCASSWDI